MVVRAGVTLSLVAGLLVGLPQLAIAAQPSGSDGDKPVSVRSAATSLPPLTPMPRSNEAPPVWPRAASAVVDLPVAAGSALGRGTGMATVGGLPVRVTPLLALADDAVSGSALSAAAAQAPTAVRVEVVERGLTSRAGFPLGVRVSRADRATAASRVRLDVDYSAFRSGFGGGWSDRLGLVLVPECGLAERVAASCPAPIRLQSHNNTVTGVVSAEVPLTTGDSSSVPATSFKQAEAQANAPSVGATGAGALVVLAAGQSGETGDFRRTDLKETGSWAAGGSSGDFAYSYPLTVPPVAGGLMPDVGLSYSSGAVDGQVSTGNTQPGILGEGWSYHPGFIERTLRPCKEDEDLTHPPHWTHNDNRPLGPCWRYDNYQLSWGGRSGELVPTATANVFKLESDDGTRVEKLTNGPTGATWGEHFKLTTTDGTQYWFGKTRLPGWVSGKPETNSVLWQAVFANHSDEACFYSGRFYDSRCDAMAYRWQLDYVVDAHGNSMGFFYDRDSSHAGVIEPVSGVRNSFPYHRASHLTRIEYGHRIGSEATAHPPAIVEFQMADRCLTTNCGVKDAVNWPDTPWDLQCDGMDCTNNMGPSYWTHRRLSKVITKVHAGNGVYKPVDQWDLGHLFPGGTSRPVLWLHSITRTGYDAAGTPATMPATRFHGWLANNRADYDPNAGMADHQKYRIQYVDSETGGRTEVVYQAPDAGCQFGQAAWPDPSSNAHRCFPQEYTNTSGSTGWSWWHKFVVDKVIVSDGTGGSPPVTTSYGYSTDGSSNKALWAYTASVWASKDKTNSRWVGYPTVATTVGADAGQQSQTKTTFYRGLDGDLSDVFFGPEHYGQGMTQVAFADIDGDGREDMITDVGSSHQLWAYRNQGYDAAEMFVSWDRRQVTSGFGPIGGLEFADVDGDTRADLIIVSGSEIWAYRNQGWNAGSGVFVGWDRRAVVSGFGDLSINTLADMDGDGRADLIAQSGANNDLYAYRNQGWNAPNMVVGWDRKPVVSGFGPIAGLEFTDADADGRADLHAAHGPGNDLWVYRNHGWGAANLFTGPTKQMSSGHGPLTWVEFADMTGDRQADLLSTAGPHHDLWIYRNQGLAAAEPIVGWDRKFVATANPSDETNNVRRSVQVIDSWEATVTDHPALAGQVRETQTLDGPGGAVLAKTITNRATVQRAGGALPTWQTPAWRHSYRSRESAVSTWTRIADGSYRRTYVGYAYDADYGRLTAVDDQGQFGVAGDDMCTRHEYADVDDASRYFIGFTKRTVTTAGSCAATPVYPGDGISEIRYTYDLQAYGAAPTRGLVTKTEQAYSYTGSTPNFTSAQTGYDQWGRVTSVKDALNRETTTVYTQNAAGRPEKVTVTNPAGHVTIMEREPLRGLPFRITDANNKFVTVSYDALGRLVKLWKPGNPIAGTADAEYRYVMSTTAPSFVESKVLSPNGNQISSYEIFDSLLRLRQTQTVTEDGKRMVTDTRYNNRGLSEKTSVFYNAASAPASTLVWPANGDADIARQSRYVYDKPGRQIKDQVWKNNVQQWETISAYEGDRTGVIPPQGGTVTQDIVDTRGRVVEKRQYESATALSGAYDKTIYGYNVQGQLTSVKDAGNNIWTYKYDLLGRKVEAVDPDAGTTHTTYDAAGQIKSTKDGLGQELFYEYDALGRKTKQRDGSATGTVMAEWNYDTVVKGQLASSIRHVGADQYVTRTTSWDNGYRPLHVETVIPNPTLNGALAGTYAWDYTYKPNGAPATVQLPGVGGLPAETLTHTYDDNGFAQTLVGTWTGGEQPYLADNEYTYDGLISKLRLGASGKRVVLENHHSAGTRRLTSQRTLLQSQATPSEYSEKFAHDYGYDAAGNIKSVAGKTDGAEDQTECFRYDHLRRLTTAWTQAALGTGCTTPQKSGAEPYWREWTFDTIGNRKTQTDKNPGGTDTTWTYTVGVKPHQLGQVTATGPLAGPARGFTYDNAGNTLTATTPTGTAQSLEWTKENRLAKVSQGTTPTAEYVYDADGNRLISRTPAKTTLYLRDGTELEQASGAQAALGTRYYAGVAVRTNAGGLKWLCTNHQGTSVAQIDAATLTATRRRMLPYGEDRGTQSGDWMGTKGYVGGTKDPSGLVHLNAREYDPTLGRFISVDPVMDLVDPNQWHGYAYSHNSPVTFSDPSGLIDTCDSDGNVTCPSQPLPPGEPDEDRGGGPSGGGGGGPWGGRPKKATTPLSPDQAKYALWDLLGQPICFGGAGGNDGLVGNCDSFAAWLPQIVQYADEAGIDPELLYAIMAIEVNFTQDCITCQNALDFGSWALDNLGIYGPLKSLTGKGDTPPSLGWMNIKADTFYATRDAHPELAGIEWTDMMGDPELSIRVAAYRLADLGKVADRTATPQMKQQFSRNQVIAAMYNTYPEGYEDALAKRGNLGPHGSTYAATAGRWMMQGNTLICSSGIWSCS